MKGTELTDRIRDEMAAAKNDYVSMMGELMTEYLRLHPQTEIDDKKNLKGAFDALQAIARKKQKGGCYAMPPREVFGEMLAYYGLAHTDADFAACMMAVIGQSAVGDEVAEDAGNSLGLPAASHTHLNKAGKENGAAKAECDDLFDLDALLGE